jgi:hypothetical protein
MINNNNNTNSIKLKMLTKYILHTIMMICMKNKIRIN